MKLALLCAEQSIMEVSAMLNDETRRKLREMQMDALIEAFDEQEKNIATYAEFSFEKRITFAVDQCYATKNAARVKRLLNGAKLRFPDADVNTLCYEARGLNKDQILTLTTGSYFTRATNIVVNGPTGSGKTYLGCALGKEACRNLHRTRYYRMPEMLEMLNLAEHKGQGISRAVTKLANYHLLILSYCQVWCMGIRRRVRKKPQLKYRPEILFHRSPSQVTRALSDGANVSPRSAPV